MSSINAARLDTVAVKLALGSTCDTLSIARSASRSSSFSPRLSTVPVACTVSLPVPMAVNCSVMVLVTA